VAVEIVEALIERIQQSGHFIFDMDKEVIRMEGVRELDDEL